MVGLLIIIRLHGILVFAEYIFIHVLAVLKVNLVNTLENMRRINVFYVILASLTETHNFLTSVPHLKNCNNFSSYQRHSRRLASLHGLLLESCVLLVNCFHVYLHRHAKTIDIMTGALFAEGKVSTKEICKPEG